MKKHIFSACLFIFIVFFTFSSAGILFEDDFTGISLDTSKWKVFIDIHGEGQAPYVADGLLYSQGYHTRIDSIPNFAPIGQSVKASARIRLSGEIQKFGFATNPNERTGPITGYYFDTLDSSYGMEPNYVWAIARYNPSSDPSPDVNLLEVKIPVTWHEFHEFEIERTPSEVIYSIDGQEVASLTDTFAGELPVGVWNDRGSSLMLTDWVRVIPEPGTLLLLGLGGLILRKRKR
ncbi:MAG: PEP-CTERM sorting domain-containing protein [Phycisphaerales bacterium]|jgi:hypothetical protein